MFSNVLSGTTEEHEERTHDGNAVESGRQDERERKHGKLLDRALDQQVFCHEAEGKREADTGEPHEQEGDGHAWRPREASRRCP